MEAFKSFLLQCQEFLVAFGQTIWKYCTDPWIATGIVLSLLAFLVLLFLSRKQPSRIRAFTNGSGYVEISRSALVDIIRSKSEQIDIEKKPGVVIRSRRGKLHVDIRIRLLPSRRLTEVSDILQQHLREALQDGLGIRKLGNINVMVTGVRVKTGKAARKSLPLNPDISETKASANQPESEPESATFEVVDDEKKEETTSPSTSEPRNVNGEGDSQSTSSSVEKTEVGEGQVEPTDTSNIEDKTNKEKGSA